MNEWSVFVPGIRRNNCPSILHVAYLDRSALSNLLPFAKFWSVSWNSVSGNNWIFPSIIVSLSIFRSHLYLHYSVSLQATFGLGAFGKLPWLYAVYVINESSLLSRSIFKLARSVSGIQITNIWTIGGRINLPWECYQERTFSASSKVTSRISVTSLLYVFVLSLPSS